MLKIINACIKDLENQLAEINDLINAQVNENLQTKSIERKAKIQRELTVLYTQRDALN